VADIEKTLSSLGVRTNGLPVGNRQLEGCRHCSIRNESFVTVSSSLLRSLSKEEQRYYGNVSALSGKTRPPNVMGHNPKGHNGPFLPARARRAKGWLINLPTIGMAVVVLLFAMNIAVWYHSHNRMFGDDSGREDKPYF
jgi:hypothetical protein